MSKYIPKFWDKKNNLISLILTPLSLIYLIIILINKLKKIQFPIEKKKKKSNFIVKNDFTLRTVKKYVKNITNQLNNIGFYSNAVRNPLQDKLSNEINLQADLDNYKLFMCNSGAEAVENALKLSSFYTGKKRIIAFKNSFHGRTSAAVAVTDNKYINSELNKQHNLSFIEFNDNTKLEIELDKGDVCAIIFESIQGVGGLDQPDEDFINGLANYQKKYQVSIIADEVQSGFCRSGQFFAFQKNHRKFQ